MYDLLKSSYHNIQFNVKIKFRIFFKKRIHIFRTKLINFLNAKYRSYMYTFSKSDHFL